jgi:ubiquitin-conjugating enzyme E2 O
VTHPDSSDGVYPLHRLTRMYDGIEQLENDLWGEEGGGAVDKSSPTATLDGDCLPVGEGQWEGTSEEAMSQGAFCEGQENGGNDMNICVIEESMASENMSVNDLANIEDGPDENPWTLFKILGSTPVDHAFYTSPPAQPSKSFLSRLRKEYIVLDSSLPGQCIPSLDKLYLMQANRHYPCSCIRGPNRFV